MGCFSYICKKSGRAVNSTSSRGDRVHLFLLKDGKVIEHMYGNYDSYGRVFTTEKVPGCELFESFEWQTDWNKVVDMHFSSNKGNGIAAILGPYWKEGDPYPTERSEDDPDQGWGRVKNGTIVSKPFHKVF